MTRTMPAYLRLLVDGPATGEWNMAVDETLLHTAQRHGIGTLRFYRWSPATLSLGYFQACSARQQHAPSRVAPCIRRASGGGAIIHDQELTYSLAIPSETHRFAASETYLLMHTTLQQVLADLQISTTLHAGPPTNGKAFLCFQRRSSGDVLCGPHKVAGSAQRRQQNAVLQHGSLLLRTSPFAPELPGLEELNPQAGTLSAEPLIDAWADGVARRFARTLAAAPLTHAETQQAEQLQATRFGNPRWLQRR